VVIFLKFPTRIKQKHFKNFRKEGSFVKYFLKNKILIFFIIIRKETASNACKSHMWSEEASIDETRNVC